MDAGWCNEMILSCSWFGGVEEYDLVSRDVVPFLQPNEFDRTMDEKDGHVTLMPLLDTETLWHAAEVGDVSAVQRCIEAGVDLDARDEDQYCALLIAAEAGHVDAVAALLAGKAAVDGADAFGRSPLYASAVAGHVDVVKFLVDAGAEVDLRDEDGRTACWASCATRRIERATRTSSNF
ncbi:hypothetical protein CTAYLR_003959 [Chrysophaeum taylorii]|uniref:Uncharacterized protein n=1 Tax=Chrysophaeum taylorii TaxID=2483200 RepID=A0AAD7UE70_9STRA|nr:hypothetical protein CTAYLR_003959 [Chrysophaeum taylorii]